MLRAVNWVEKLGQFFNGHHGRVLKILILFICALGVLVGIYRVRSQRIDKETDAITKNKLISASIHAVPVASTTKWVIVANPDDADSVGLLVDQEQNRSGNDYVCSTAQVAQVVGWKTIIIGTKLPCCRKPDCFAIHKSQFLRMTYKTAGVIRTLTENGKYPYAYKETIRNIAFIWAMHRGARYIFDAYVDEYQSAGVSIAAFEEELSRQLQTLALDDSLALVEERSRSRLNLFRNPYKHFGRPDVRLLPSGPGTGSGSNSHTHSHNTGVGNIGKTQTIPPHPINKLQDFPTFRICEVRPPSIEKFLEIDEGWWDLKAPALVLPGDTMPPLCTRNTLFSPEVFWALPLLPDYTAGDNNEELPEVPQNASRIPPWYIRGLWSQSLLGDLGGSIRLTLSRVPTLQLNQDYFVGGDYEPNVVGGNHLMNGNRTGTSKLLKRWHCRSRSTFRCLLLMSKELSKSLYLGKTDLSLIEAWITDLRSIHYAEPPMLPKRRSITNPCLGADGLHGVSFHPSLEPKSQFTTDEFVSARNDTLRSLVAKFEAIKSIKSIELSREKRETESPLELALFLKPPDENSTFISIDWSAHVSQVEPSHSPNKKSPIVERDASIEIINSPVSEGQLEEDSYLVPISGRSERPITYSPFYNSFGQSDSKNSYDALASASRKIISVDEKPIFSPTAQLSGSASFSRTGKHFRSFLQQIAAKSAQDGIAADSFPILKAMADNMCPGFGPLIPYQPKLPQTDILLIVVFTNQHYDLIPTLEVMYRPIFPNLLYCGHPHESVEIFLRKYQTVEHRSFSFLPTYTKATYECVLGAIEMNYGVKGYLVVTDETLMKSWNVVKEDKEKIWVSTSGYEKITRSTWQRLDPGGQKLPRLLEGISATWKLFSYILGGQDTYQYLDAKGRSRRSLHDAETPTHETKVAEAEPEVVSAEEVVPEKLPIPEKLIAIEDELSDRKGITSDESFEAEETSYTDPQRTKFRWGVKSSDTNGSSTSENPENANNSTNLENTNSNRTETEDISGEKANANSAGDLQVSDWDYVKNSRLSLLDPIDFNNNETEKVDSDMSSGSEDNTTEEEVLVGEEEDENNPESSASMADIIGLGIIEDDTVSSSPSPIPPDDQVTDDVTVPIIPAEEEDGLENSTLIIWPITPESSTVAEIEAQSISSTTSSPTESALGVPIYHVEHVEPPTPPTWHKPDELSTSSSSTTPSTTTADEELVPGTGAPAPVPVPSQGQGEEVIALFPPTSESETSRSSSSVVPSEEPLGSSVGPSSTTIAAAGQESKSSESEGGNISSSILGTELSSSSTTQEPPTESELKTDMDSLLDSLHETYANMLAIVGDYQEHNNETNHSSEYSAEVFDPTHLEGTKSHRISPREFRHIRCTRVDDGHQSDLCSTLRQYINILSRNSGRDIRIIHDAVPMYYIPTSATKPFYSVANVLLHYGVMDELALPLIFRGLDPEADWVRLSKSPQLGTLPPTNKNQYIFPFNLHKVYSDPNVKEEFCFKYLLRIFQM